MLRAYIDDSGRGQPPVFVLAGFVARAEQWEEFSDAWKELLDRPPRLDYFKMREAARLEGQFKGWSEKDRDSRLWEMLTIIKRHAMLAVRWIVPTDAYERTIKDRIAKGADNPYFLSFFAIMIGLIKYQHDHGLSEPVDFVFDEQLDASTLVQKGYDSFAKFAPDEVKHLIGARLIHRDDKELLPLQSADLLAWQTRRYYLEKSRGIRYDDWVWRSLGEVESVDYEMTANRLKQLLERMRELNRAEGKVFPYDLPRRDRKRKR